MSARGATERTAIRLRQASEADWALLRHWLRLPEIVAWWGPTASTEAELISALGSPHAICRIIEVDGAPVGYAHAVDAALWGENLPDDLAPGTWEIDLFIASPLYRGTGVGPYVLEQLKSEVFETTLAVACCVFASIANERAVRAYEKAGFRWRRVVSDPIGGPAWFMIAEREGGVGNGPLPPAQGRLF